MAEDGEDPEVAAWRALLVAHSQLVPAVETDLRAAGQVSLSWYDVLLELNAAPGRRLRMSELGQRAVLSRTRVSRVVDELAAAGLAELAHPQPTPWGGVEFQQHVIPGQAHLPGRPQVSFHRGHQPAVRNQQGAPGRDLRIFLGHPASVPFACVRMHL